MPQQTFFNLPDDKRQIILDLAIEEFAGRNYGNASISRIVDRAGIAKGSFYQYFKDKRDLHLYLLDLATEEKLDYLRGQQPPVSQTDFFAYLRWLLEANLEFDFSHPHLSQILYRAWCSDMPRREETLARIAEPVLAYYRRLIEEGIDQGNLTSDVDPDLTAFLLNALITDVRRFFLIKLGIKPERLARGEFTEADNRGIQIILDDLARILEHGLARGSQR